MKMQQPKRPFLPQPPSQHPYVHIFFMDGVGLGSDDPAVNPFCHAAMPALTSLLGENWFATRRRLDTPCATLVPTDPNLGVSGRPQSATGQATILTGKNVPQLIGEHYGPKPNAAVREIIRQGSLFAEVTAVYASHTTPAAALLSPYPQGYFDSLNSGKRLPSAVPMAAMEGGVALKTAVDLQQGHAVSPGFTNQAWREQLGYSEMPLLTLEDAGQRLAQLAATYRFSFFEHWPSDRLGHRGTLADAARHLEMLDTVLGSLIANWPDDGGLLLITSDHGNLEEKHHRQHTTNPVPTIVVGANHAHYASQIETLADIAPVVRHYLNLS